MAIRSLWRQDQLYNAQDDRLAIQALTPYMQEGVARPADLKVTQRAAGVNMSVDVAAGFAFIDGDDSVSQGYYVLYNDSVANRTILAPSANPRRDLVIARVQDATEAGAVNSVTIEVLQGTPAVSNPVAPALPNNAIPLASVLVNTGAVSITNADLTEARSLGGTAVMPRGEIGYAERVTDLNVDTTVRDFATVAVTVAEGRKVKITGQVRGLVELTSAGVVLLAIYRDGVEIRHRLSEASGSPDQDGGVVVARDLPSAGTVTYAFRLQASSGTVLAESTGTEAGFILVEDVGGRLI